MARVARLGVVVNDLDRGRLGWVGAWLLGHLRRGTASRGTTRRCPSGGRTAAEMRGLVREAGLPSGPCGEVGQRFAIAARHRVATIAAPAVPP